MQEEAEQEEAQDQQEDAEQEELPPANLSEEEEEEEKQRWYHGWRTCDNDAGAGAETYGDDEPPANLSEEETQRWYHGWRTCDNDAGAGDDDDDEFCQQPEHEPELEMEDPEPVHPRGVKRPRLTSFISNDSSSSSFVLSEATEFPCGNCDAETETESGDGDENGELQTSMPTSAVLMEDESSFDPLATSEATELPCEELTEDE